MSPRRMKALVETYGFVEYASPGFDAFARRHPDGRHQALSVFWWKNIKIADRDGIPHAYMVVCPSIGSLDAAAGGGWAATASLKWNGPLPRNLGGPGRTSLRSSWTCSCRSSTDHLMKGSRWLQRWTRTVTTSAN